MNVFCPWPLSFVFPWPWHMWPWFWIPSLAQPSTGNMQASWEDVSPQLLPRKHAGSTCWEEEWGWTWETWVASLCNIWQALGRIIEPTWLIPIFKQEVMAAPTLLAPQKLCRVKGSKRQERLLARAAGSPQNGPGAIQHAGFLTSTLTPLIFAVTQFLHLSNGDYTCLFTAWVCEDQMVTRTCPNGSLSTKSRG